MFDGFTLLSTHRFPSLFIKRQDIWFHGPTNAYLSRCHYEKKCFDTELFRKLSIELPLAINRSSIVRQREFLAGRCAAKLAITAMSGRASVYQVGVGDKRQPVFPGELSGSISHSKNEAICVVQSAASTASTDIILGIDVEPIISVQGCDVIAERVSNQSERMMISKLGLQLNECATILLSAKERDA